MAAFWNIWCLVLQYTAKNMAVLKLYKQVTNVSFLKTSDFSLDMKVRNIYRYRYGVFDWQQCRLWRRRRHRAFRDLLVVGIKLNTHVGCNVPWIGVVFHTNIVNFVLVIINTCRCVKMCSVEKLGTLKDLDKDFEKNNHRLEGGWKSELINWRLLKPILQFLPILSEV